MLPGEEQAVLPLSRALVTLRPKRWEWRFFRIIRYAPAD